MPIYEYRCNQCGAVFSRLFRSVRAAESAPESACPACGSADAQRLISRVAVLGESAPEPSPLFGRKELQERLRRDRNRQSIARIGDD